MRTLIALMILSVPLVASAGPFDGTWMGDVSTATIEGKPDSYLLQNGQFTCSPCYPEVTIPADGKPHKVTGHSYYDELTASVAGPQAVKLSATQGGKKFYERTMTVSADGKTLLDDFTMYQGGKSSTGKFSYTRVKSGPAGSHPISGSWQADNTKTSMSEDLLTVSFQETPDGLKMSVPTGQSYDAKFDGKEYLTSNDPGKTLVKLEKLGPRKIRETDKRNGVVTDVIDMEVAADGKSMKVTDDDQLHGTKMTYTARKK